MVCYHCRAVSRGICRWQCGVIASRTLSIPELSPGTRYYVLVLDSKDRGPTGESAVNRNGALCQGGQFHPQMAQNPSRFLPQSTQGWAEDVFPYFSSRGREKFLESALRATAWYVLDFGVLGTGERVLRSDIPTLDGRPLLLSGRPYSVRSVHPQGY
jgi:hypothetical protein